LTSDATKATLLTPVASIDVLGTLDISLDSSLDAIQVYFQCTHDNGGDMKSPTFHLQVKDWMSAFSAVPTVQDIS
jgi:hypothetical protein